MRNAGAGSERGQQEACANPGFGVAMHYISGGDASFSSSRHNGSPNLILPSSSYRMSDLKEHAIEVDNIKEEVDALRSLHGVAALEVAGRLEPPKKTSKRMLQLYVICGFMYLGSTMVSLWAFYLIFASLTQRERL